MIAERIEVREFFFRPKKFQQRNIEIVAVEVTGKIEEMHFDNALGRLRRDGGADADVCHAGSHFAIAVPRSKRNPTPRSMSSVSMASLPVTVIRAKTIRAPGAMPR